MRLAAIAIAVGLVALTGCSSKDAVAEPGASSQHSPTPSALIQSAGQSPRTYVRTQWCDVYENLPPTTEFTASIDPSGAASMVQWASDWTNDVFTFTQRMKNEIVPQASPAVASEYQMIDEPLQGTVDAVIAFGLAAQKVVDQGVAGHDDEQAVSGSFSTVVKHLDAWNSLCKSLTASSSSKIVSRYQFGDGWPLTVEEGLLQCQGAGAITFTVDDVTYAVNGTAQDANAEWSDINQIWADDPDVAGVKVSIEPLITAGQKLCP